MDGFISGFSEYTAFVMMIFTSPYRLSEYHHDACSIFSYNPQMPSNIIQLSYNMKLTLLRNTNYSHVHCKLTSFSTYYAYQSHQDQPSLCRPASPFSQTMDALTLLLLLNICTLPSCLCIPWFLWILLGKLAIISCKGNTIVAKLFCLNTIPTQSWWTTVLQLREGWLAPWRSWTRAVSLASITICERSMWILRFCDAWLLSK